MGEAAVRTGGKLFCRQPSAPAWFAAVGPNGSECILSVPSKSWRRKRLRESFVVEDYTNAALNVVRDPNSEKLTSNEL